MDSVFVVLESKHNYHVLALAEIRLYYSFEYIPKIFMLGNFTGRHGKRSLIKSHFKPSVAVVLYT